MATWLQGQTEASVTFPLGVVARVEINPGRYLPDVDRTNNVWSARSAWPVPQPTGEE